MKEKSTRIVVEFKEPLVAASPTNEDRIDPNLLVIEIGPNERISLQLNTKDPEHKGGYKPVPIDLHTSQENSPEAYENLIRDALNGDPTFFAHWDEVELSWQWVQPILDAFEENLVPLHSYAAGTYGPAVSDELLAKDGYHWWFDVKPEQNNEINEGERYVYHTNY